jgi:5-methylcytosine-specific restriction protein A
VAFDPGIAPGAKTDNSELTEIFMSGLQGGMRQSHSTGTLALMSSREKSPCNDRWIGDVLHYTGLGLQCDQRLDYSQNSTLAESDVNGVDVHLFEVHKPHPYTYAGRVKF